MEGTEAHSHQVLALGGRLRLRVHHGPHARKHVVHHRDSLSGLRDPRIGVLSGRLRRWRAGLRLPHPQRPELRIAGHQLAQGRGTGARQPDDEHRSADDLVVDLRVLLVGVDDPQSLDQGIADGRMLNDVAQVVQIGFGVQRLDGAFQTFAVVGRTEILQAGRCARAVLSQSRFARKNRSCGEPFVHGAATRLDDLGPLLLR